ncbi:MAG TPA: hypothetical protein VMU77_01410, partial [Acidimicrobiales bacterium]|nr:hypothetical protein [Acidimicrobiales bacterium]
AKPLIRVLAPELGFLDQPLSGECSAPRYVLEKVFASARSGGSWEGYGIEMEILLAVAEMYGAESIAQVDLGNRIHRNRPLAELTGIANAVVDVLLSERIEKVRNRFLDTP